MTGSALGQPLEPIHEPDWLARAKLAAQQSPTKLRQPLVLATDGHAAFATQASPASVLTDGASVVVGSVEPQVLLPLRGLARADGQALLSCASPHGHGPWAVQGATPSDWSNSLDVLARALRAQGHVGPWRNEALAVRGPDGQVWARLERGLVRVLGVATQAVHLLGWSGEVPPVLHAGANPQVPRGVAQQASMWVQQRALNKPNDPSMWDTLMGGMVPASDSLKEALARETWEEAGLQIDQLHGLRYGGQLRIERPSADGQGTGYMVELIDWFEAALPEGLQPSNQDGEVAQFGNWPLPALMQRLQSGDFTLEASLVLAQALGFGSRSA